MTSKSIPLRGLVTMLAGLWPFLPHSSGQDHDNRIEYISFQGALKGPGGNTIVDNNSPKTSTIEFQDDSFNDADWTLIVFAKDASAKAGQRMSGGNPDSFRLVTLNEEGEGFSSVIAYNISRLATYDPRSGPIISLDWSNQTKLFKGFGLGEFNHLAIVQNGRFFFAGGGASPQFAWTVRSNIGLTQADFVYLTNYPVVNYQPDLTLKPDFSTNGAPISFGFLQRDENGGRGNYSLQQGIDNWSVTLHISIPAEGSAPTVSLINPIQGAIYDTGTNVFLRATALDADGTVTNVSFFMGSDLIGNRTSQPYSVTWSNLVAGTFALTARATDNQGLTSTSAPVQITVAADGPRDQTFRHIGKVDPVTDEGWTPVIFGLEVSAGAVENDMGLDGWTISNTTSGYIYYTKSLAASQVATAASNGWAASTTLRLTEGGSPGAQFLAYGDGERSWQVILYPSATTGDPVVELWKSNIDPFPITGAGAGYHTYEIKFDSLTGNHSFWFDGTQIHPDFSGGAYVGEPFVMWGTGRAVPSAAHWHAVSFNISSNPPSSIPDCPPGLVALWRGEGDAVASFGGGSGEFQNGSRFAPGKAGIAFSFDGQSNYVRMPDITHGAAEGTVQLWFKANDWNPEARASGLYLWSATASLPEDTTPGDGISLGSNPAFSETGELMFGLFVPGAGWEWALSGVRPELGEWYHLAGTWGEGGLRIYVNGNLTGTNSYTGPAPAYTKQALLGRSSWPLTGFHGVIDELAVFSRALLPQEIAAIYEFGGAGICSDASKGGRLTVELSSANQIQIRFPTVAGRSHVLERTESGLDSWVTDQEFLGTGEPEAVFRSVSGGRFRYYRLRTL